MYNESIAHEAQQRDEPECDGTSNIPQIEVEGHIFAQKHPCVISPGSICDIVVQVFNYFTIRRHV